MRYIKKTLKNGLRVIAVPMKDATSVTVLVAVEAGSEYETKDVNGVFHFLEHMCFKGTARRPTSLDISKELDAIGADYNAFTGLEYTGYYAKSHPKHFGKILDVVSDIYLNSAFDEREIEKERGVIIEEINMNRDTPSRQVHDDFGALLYGDQPAGRPVTGTKETVKGLSREHFVGFHRKHYVPGSTVVVVAGNFDTKAAFKEVAKKFDGMSAAKKPAKPKTKDVQAGPQLALRYKDSDQTHIVLGVRAYPVMDPRARTLTVLNAAIGGGMSSRLWQRVRGELGLGYYVYSFFDTSLDHGYFAVGAGVDNSRVPDAVEAIMGVLREFKERPLTDIELKKAKDYYLGGMYLGLETSDALGWFYGNQEILEHELKKPVEVSAEVKAVTAQDAYKVAKEIFDAKKLNLALIGRYKDEAKLKGLLKF